MVKFFNDDMNLYSPTKEDYLNSLEYAKTLPNSNNHKLVFHFFWRVPRDFGRKQLAVLKSVIVNHIDIIETVEINLWSNVDLTDNVFFKEVDKFVTFRIWDLYDEIKDTVLENCDFLLNKNNIDDEVCYLESDLFRLLILHKYGGFYLDMDVLVLRNLLPLNNYEFVYQWGTSGFRGEEFKMNNAVIKLDKKSDTSLEFLELLKKTPPSKNTSCWGSQMFPSITRNNILTLPGIWFNPEWGFEGTLCQPFIKVDNVEMFDGSFTWHWHNKWDDEIQVGSKFQILEEKHDKIFKELL